MAKYKFTTAQRYAVFQIFGANCSWCKEVLFFKDCELDHVIPESLKQEEIEKLIIHYKLPENFAVNSFSNWLPLHSRCNKEKAAKIFDAAPFIGSLLHKINKRLPEIENLYEKAKLELSNTSLTAQLESAIENKKITQKDIETLLSKYNKSNKIKPATIYEIFNCKTVSISEKGKYGKKSPKQTYEITYEQFDTEIKSLNELNSLIKSDATEELMNARDNYFNYLKDYTEDDYFSDMDSSHEYYMNFALVTKKFVSYTCLTRFYNTGAAHGQYGVTGSNYYLNPLRHFHLSHIMQNYNAFVETITPLAYGKMIDEIRRSETDLEVTEYSPIEKEWLTAEYHAFENYHFCETGLVFIFNPYQISAWSYGAHFPEFSFDELILLFPHETQFVELIDGIKKSVEKSKKNKMH